MYSVKVKLCIKGADKKYCPCLPPACLPGPCLVMPRCLPVRPLPCKVPVQARSRSDKCAAVLRLQRTQPKDRRIYTAFTGILGMRMRSEITAHNNKCPSNQITPIRSPRCTSCCDGGKTGYGALYMCREDDMGMGGIR